MTAAALETVKRAIAKGVVVVRSSPVNAGIVRRNIEVDDDKLGTVAAGELNPPKARVLLQLVLLKTSDAKQVQQVQNDVLSGEWTFSNRFRYPLSFNIPVSKNPAVPLLVLSDEIMGQFGPSIVLNTFDQNRFFAGIKKTLSPSWSFDLGYMPVYQQKSSGYQYDLNQTLQWFFYFTPDLKKTKSTHESAGNEE